MHTLTQCFCGVSAEYSMLVSIASQPQGWTPDDQCWTPCTWMSCHCEHCAQLSLITVILRRCWKWWLRWRKTILDMLFVFCNKERWIVRSYYLMYWLMLVDSLGLHIMCDWVPRVTWQRSRRPWHHELAAAFALCISYIHVQHFGKLSTILARPDSFRHYIIWF
jgi:hypothetical protein